MKSRYILFSLMAIRGLLTFTGCGETPISIDSNVSKVESMEMYMDEDFVFDNCAFEYSVELDG